MNQLFTLYDFCNDFLEKFDEAGASQNLDIYEYSMRYIMGIEAEKERDCLMSYFKIK